MWEQNPSHHEKSWPWVSVFVMCVNFLDVRWDEVLSMLCLASSWLLWVISYNTVVSRLYKPTGWFYLHWRPGGIKWQAGMTKQAGLPLNPTKWGGKHKLTPPSKPSDIQVSSTANSLSIFQKNWRINGKTLRFKLTYCPKWYFSPSRIYSGRTWWCVSGQFSTCLFWISDGSI